MKISNWYKKWHRNPLHAYYHWGALALVATGFILLTLYSYTQASVAAQLKYNPSRFPPDLKSEYDQIVAQGQQYDALAKQAKAIYDTGVACEKSCPCGANACPAGTDQDTGLAHDQCIITCDAVIPQLQSMASQLQSMKTDITQRSDALGKKLAALKPSNLSPLPAAVACGEDGKTKCSEDEARDYLLEDEHISINKDACTATKKKDCTSVGNMKPETMDQIVQLQEACNCDIRLTGGTEGLHAQGTYSHTNGYKYDMSNDEKGHSAVNKYIIDNCTAGNSCKVDYRDKAKTQKRYTYNLGYETVEYVNEKDAVGGSHWDVSVLPKKTPVKK